MRTAKKINVGHHYVSVFCPQKRFIRVHNSLEDKFLGNNTAIIFELHGTKCIVRSRSPLSKWPGACFLLSFKLSLPILYICIYISISILLSHPLQNEHHLHPLISADGMTGGFRKVMLEHTRWSG